MSNRVSNYEVKNGESPDIIYIKNPDPQPEPVKLYPTSHHLVVENLVKLMVSGVRLIVLCSVFIVLQVLNYQNPH